MIRWIGALCIVGACGACGFSMAAGFSGLLRCLRQLQNALELMRCQMEYRMTELPELCGILAAACTGPVGRVFGELGQELGRGEAADVPACMAMALARSQELPAPCRDILMDLGGSLGQLNLSGQLRGLDAAMETCRQTAARIEAEKEGRLRSYRALGLCGGAALAILLM